MGTLLRCYWPFLSSPKRMIHLPFLTYTRSSKPRTSSPSFLTNNNTNLSCFSTLSSHSQPSSLETTTTTPTSNLKSKSPNSELWLFNTMSREKEFFKSKVPGKVGMYVCGITSYDLSHIGHARAYVAFDVLFRYLKYLGYEVRYVRNFTDVDDKESEGWAVTEEDDSWRWTSWPDGNFTVSAMYDFLRSRGEMGSDLGSFPVRLVWRNDVPPKICVFLWGMFRNRLATLDVLLRRHVDHGVMCPLCIVEHESRDHLLLSCPFAWDVWTQLIRACGLEWVFPCSVTQLLCSWTLPGHPRPRADLFWRVLPPAVCWAIWKERNGRIFGNSARNSKAVFVDALAYVWNWCCNSPLIRGVVFSDLVFNLYSVLCL